MLTPSRNISLDLMEQATRWHKDAALIRPDGEVSHASLDTLVWQMTRHLHAQGIRAGQVVAVRIDSEFLLAIGLLALARLGATSLTLPRASTPADCLLWTQLTQACSVLTDTHASSVFNLPCIRADGDWANSPHSHDSALLCEFPPGPLTIHVGSGSTGRPKLIPLGHEQMRARFELARHNLPLHPGSRSLRLSSLEYATVQTFLLHSLHLGASVCVNEFGQMPVNDIVTRCGITSLNMSVFHAEQLLQKHSPHKRKLFPGLETVGLGGSTVSDKLRHRIHERCHGKLSVGYGTNECLFIALASEPHVLATPGTVGFSPPGMRVEVVDAQDQPLPAGQPGIIRVQSAGAITHYWNDPEQTARSFRNGWFYPGDMGQMTPEGELTHLGRSDQMMIFNGVNIYPVEVEQCLSAFPGVKDVTAFPLPHEAHQDVPVCAVSLLPGYQINPQALQEFAQSILGFRSPKVVFVIDHIPRTPLGKIIREQLFDNIRASRNHTR